MLQSLDSSIQQVLLLLDFPYLPLQALIILDDIFSPLEFPLQEFILVGEFFAPLRLCITLLSHGLKFQSMLLPLCCLGR